MTKRDTALYCLTASKTRAEPRVVTREGSGNGSAEGDLSREAVSVLIAFFKLLDEWDREANTQ